MATRFLDKVNNLSDIQNLPGSAGIGVHGGIPYIKSDAGLMPLDTSKLLNPPIFVAGNAIGSDSNDGLSWDKPYLTMQKAFDNVASGGVIFFRGNIREQIDTPAGVFDVSVIGYGNRPRHADAHTTNGGYSANTWKTPASEAATTPLVRVLQQGWRFVNILFAGPSDDACIVLYRDAGAGDAERDASHAEIIGCRFASGQDGIHVVEVSNVLIQDCQFHELTGHAVLGVAGAGIANPLRGRFLDNIVQGCANGFYVSCNQWVIQRNVFDDGETPNTTTVLDTKGPGANGANNIVTDNVLQVATANFNTPDVVGGTGDVWTGNKTPDAAGAGVSGIYEIGSPA